LGTPRTSVAGGDLRREHVGAAAAKEVRADQGL
jgi:hypothetical protein